MKKRNVLLTIIVKRLLYIYKLKIQFKVEKEIPLVYEELKLETSFKADIIIESKVIFEIKSISAIADIHLKQLLTYIKLADCKLGILINFNSPLLKDGIRRVANNLQ